MTADEPRAPEGAESAGGNPGPQASQSAAGDPQPADASAQPATAQSGPQQVNTGEVKQQTIAGTVNNYTYIIDREQLSAIIRGDSAGVSWGAQLSEIRRERQDYLRLYPSQQTGGAGPSPQSEGQPSGPDGMPADEKELYDWFRKLTAIERCHVRATAILHAAPTITVTEARDELYAAVFPRARANAKPLQADVPGSLQFGHVIMEHTLTVARYVGGAERMYWKDVDSEGQSAFGVRALNLLAGEIAGTSGVYSENSRAVIERWVSSGKQEFFQRAAYALGVILRKLDQQRLRNTVRDWARSAKASERQCAPLMAWGAFVAEHAERGQSAAPVTAGAAPPRAPGPPPAPGAPPETEATARSRTESYNTLSMLAHMADETQLNPGQDVPKLVERALTANAVSAAYGLIGIEWTDHALDGLDHLMGLDPAYDRDTPQVIPHYVCLPTAVTYALVAADGHVRESLARLGAHARRLGRKGPTRIISGQAERERETQRKDRLFNTLLAFYFMVSASSPASRRTWTRYGERDRLDDSPRFDAESGRDVLLDGLLSDGETALQMDTQSLLWASLTGDAASLAEEALGIWAERIAQVALDSPGTLAAPAFERFLLSLDALIGRRDDLSGYTGAGSPRARYRRLLERWSMTAAPAEKKRKISAMARNVLAVLPAL